MGWRGKKTAVTAVARSGERATYRLSGDPATTRCRENVQRARVRPNATPFSVWAVHFRERVGVAKYSAARSQPTVAYGLKLKKYFANLIANLAKWQSARSTRLVRNLLHEPRMNTDKVAGAQCMPSVSCVVSTTACVCKTCRRHAIHFFIRVESVLIRGSRSFPSVAPSNCRLRCNPILPCRRSIYDPGRGRRWPRSSRRCRK